ncbi:MAG: hypothetical protein HUU01_05255 [Saprospiraceae bacterium]|nr:hypothetical protein [Saprospiraceae bacterium]
MKASFLVKQISLSFAALFIFLSGTFASASPIPGNDSNPPKWEFLGSKKVDYTLDRDEIIVTAREGKFTAVKFLVKKSGINLHKCVVHFENGGIQELDLRENIPAGGETRVIDLDGKRRFIEKIVFWYDSKNYEDRKAVIEAWGRH